jgi:hypothetical protein
MHKPGIVTAIPRRRYTFGEFSVIVLGDVESNDGVDYRYIAAVVQGKDPEPGMYITAELCSGSRAAHLDMRLVMRDGAQIIGSSDEWGDLDVFTEEALQVISRILNLGDETPYRLA